MKSDIEIARSVNPMNIMDVAKKIGICDYIIPYGKYKAKISIDDICDKKIKSKLILVTAINPTPMGEGKTTVSISLSDALNKLGKKSILALREPSLGPVFGIKGGAAGGGYAQVIPMEDINLHFNGDFHAITSANNLLCSLIDNHIYFGNELGIDKVTFKRCLDLNDRQLRVINTGLSGESRIVPRVDGFDITAASEIMAILCLSRNIDDLKRRLGNIVIGYNKDGKEVTARDLKAEGAMAVLLHDAILPNLVQTLEGNPAIIHGGPFANIAHGCNSVIATNTAMKLGDYTVTEAGFGADLGAEKFLDIKCRQAGLNPDAVVIVATVRALKMHGGVNKKELGTENLEALKKGIGNLTKHIENIKKFGLPCIVAINAFPTDTEAELKLLDDMCKELNVEVSISEVWAKGGEGGIDLANKLLNILDTEESHYAPIYSLDMPIDEKIKTIAKEIYGADDVVFTKKAANKIKKFTAQGLGDLPICIAKTQYSLSDDATLLGRPEGFKVTINDLIPNTGSGFLVAISGNIMRMPGLPKVPAANNMDIDEEGKITGLF